MAKKVIRPKTVRANLTDREHRQFIVLAARRDLNRTQLAGQIIKGWIAEQIRLCPSIVVGIVVEETKTRKLTTRQFDRLKRLKDKVPDCEVNNATDRELTYPARFEAEVIEFVNSCPKGSKHEAEARREAKVYKKMDPTAKPGLKAAKKERATSESKHTRILREAECLLENGSMELGELYATLKEKEQVPTGKDPKYILKSLLTQTGRYTYDRFSKIISKIQLEEDVIVEDPPVVIEETPVVVEVPTTEPEKDILKELSGNTDEIEEETPPVSETHATAESKSTYDPRVPSFFPKNIKIG
jgi:hypothetical protein